MKRNAKKLFALILFLSIVTTAFALTLNKEALQNAFAQSNSSGLPVTSITASGHDGNVPENTRDSNLGTRWSAKGDGQWIRYDLGSEESVSGVQIAFYVGTTRKAYFTVETSTNGSSWSSAYDGESSGSTNALQTFNFSARNARYVRIVGGGNSNDGWNSYTEVIILGQNIGGGIDPTVGPNPTDNPGGGGGEIPVSSVRASTSDANVAQNTLDNNLSTRWSGNGKGANIVFDLGSSADVASVGIAFYRGTVRTQDFVIQLSTNNSSWQTVFTGKSSGNTTQMQSFSFNKTAARYVKIVGNGNTENKWNSLTEVKIYGQGGGGGPIPTTGPTNAPVGQIDETDDSVGWNTSNPTATSRPSNTATARPSVTTNPTNNPTNNPTTNPTTNPSQSPIVGGGIPTVPNLKVAFTGDTDLAEEWQSVLNLVKAEGANAFVIAGDMAYSTNPTEIKNLWLGKLNATLGANYPYFVNIGNHEPLSTWQNDYVPDLTARMAANGATVGGNVATSNFTAEYKGLKFVFTDSENSGYINTALSGDNHIWKVCAWHELMRNMQIGGKGDQSNWPMYENSRTNGCIVAGAHEHSYERTKTLSHMQNMTIDPAWPDPKNLRVTRGSTFAFVSGLGGASVRAQERCLTTSEAGCNIWASIRTSNQNATFGAFFITFNVDGDPRKATAYFKEVSGQVTDPGITITSN